VGVIVSFFFYLKIKKSLDSKDFLQGIVMSFLETAVVIGKNGDPLYWHEPLGRTSVYIPDSQNLWDVLWENRDDLLGVAHTHPGNGKPVPSPIDLDTFYGCELGLGFGLAWWIATEDEFQEFRLVHFDRKVVFPGLDESKAEKFICSPTSWMDSSGLCYSTSLFELCKLGPDKRVPDWVHELRSRSGYEGD